MESMEAKAKLAALKNTVDGFLRNPMSRYFDPRLALELFERWASVRDSLRARFPTLLAELPTRELPSPSKTTDFDGRGYLTRVQLEQLRSDMSYAADSLAGIPDSPAPQVKITREGVFFAGQYFDALREVNELIVAAKTSISLIDGYIGVDTLNILTAKGAGIPVQVLTKEVSAAMRTAAQAFLKQYGPIEVRVSKAFHDRFLIIDDSEIYHFGASIKDLGNRGFMFSRVEEVEVVNTIRDKFAQEWTAAKVIIP